VKLLLERGADIHALNSDGQTPYQTLLTCGYREVADLLREKTRQSKVRGDPLMKARCLTGTLESLVQTGNAKEAH
jgi:ankyrin repeat protein